MKKSVLIGIIAVVLAAVAVVTFVVIAPKNNCKHDDPSKIVVVEAVAPTCQKTGLTEGKKCTLCDTMVVPQSTVQTTGCSISDWIVDVEATKTENGKRHTECTMCREVLTEQIIAAGSQDLIYFQNGDNTYQVCGMRSWADTDVVIPCEYDGLPVTGIKFRAFYRTSLTSITIPDSVTNIDDEAFYGCYALNDVYYTGDVEDWLEIDFEDDRTTPMVYAENLYFGGELVTELVISDSVTSIGDYAFYGCNSLASVVIPESVTSIDAYAFYGCNSLASIIFEGTVKQWISVAKGSSWNDVVPAKEVICSDGTVTLE